MRVTRRALDLGAGLGLALLGAAVWRAGATTPPSFLDTAFGSGYLPALAGGALVALSALLALEGARRAGDEVALELDGRIACPLAVVAALAVLVANLSLDVVPFYPAAAAFVFAVAVLLGGRRNLVASAACALATAALTWVVFTRIFVILI